MGDLQYYCKIIIEGFASSRCVAAPLGGQELKKALWPVSFEKAKKNLAEYDF